MNVLPALTATTRFDQACTAVVDYLRQAVPLGFWSITRFDGERQQYLSVNDVAYGLSAGESLAWEDTLCQHMVTGVAPQINPDVNEVPEYANAAVRRRMPIGAYVGIPILRADGGLFGTVCGVDPSPQLPSLQQHAPLLALITSLLSTILEADLERTRAQRAAELAEMQADTDALTGLYNRRAWNRFLLAEEDRYRRFGDPGAVVILDLDRVKEINDNRGHAAGDEHIRLAAQIVLTTCRITDVVARLGGDEFGVLAANTSPGQAAALVERIEGNLADAGVAGSLGHAPYTIVSGFPGAWQTADEAMYREKRRRRLLAAGVAPAQTGPQLKANG